MKLYQFPISTYSQKVLIAMYHKGIEFESENVFLFDPDQAAQYREIYPLGKIPLLVDGDHMVPESSIIIEYIDRMADPRLIPDDPEQSRKVRFKDRMYDLYLADSITTLIFQAWKPEAERDQDRIRQAEQRVGVMYSFMENEFENQPFSSGSEFSLSDCAAAAGLFYADQVAPFDDKPNIVRYWERLRSIPAIQRVHAEARPILEKMADKENAA